MKWVLLVVIVWSNDTVTYDKINTFDKKNCADVSVILEDRASWSDDVNQVRGYCVTARNLIDKWLVR